MSREQTNEHVVDYYNQLECGDCDVEAFYDQIESSLQGSSITSKAKTLSHCPAMIYLIKELAWHRWNNPIAFDLMCLKFLEPNLSYDEITEKFRCDPKGKSFIPTRAVWNHRARVAEAVTQMEEMKQMITDDIDYLKQLRAEREIQATIAQESDKRFEREIHRLENKLGPDAPTVTYPHKLPPLGERHKMALQLARSILSHLEAKDLHELLTKAIQKKGKGKDSIYSMGTLSSPPHPPKGTP